MDEIKTAVETAGRGYSMGQQAVKNCLLRSSHNRERGRPTENAMQIPASINDIQPEHICSEN